MQPMSRLEATLFFRLVSYRYQRGATMITTNKPVKDWPEILAGDEVMAAALLDRLLHRCHVLNIKGRPIGCGTWRSCSSERPARPGLRSPSGLPPPRPRRRTTHRTTRKGRP